MQKVSPKTPSSRILVQALSGLGALVLLAGCTSHTSATSTWHETGMRGSKFDKVLVVAVTDNGDRRMTFEDAVSLDLQGPSTEAWPSSRLMDTQLPVDKESIGPIAKQFNANAIVVTQVTSLRVDPVEVDAYTDVMARRKEGSAFRYDYIEKEQTAYLTTNYTTVLTTDVYAADSGEHIYTMVTTAEGQETVNDVINVLSGVIAKRLRSDGVIR